MGGSARWIGNHGFSIGISDVQPSDSLYDEKEKLIKEGYDKCGGQIKLYNEGQLPLVPGFDAAQSLETGITSLLNNIRDQTGKVSFLITVSFVYALNFPFGFPFSVFFKSQSQFLVLKDKILQF